MSEPTCAERAVPGGDLITSGIRALPTRPEQPAAPRADPDGPSEWTPGARVRGVWRHQVSW